MTHKGKRARVTPDAKAYIINRALEYPRIQRSELARKLQGELKAKRYDVPALEVLERWISKYRNNPSDPEDGPWSIGKLRDWEIPPETLSIVLKVAAYSKQKRGRPLSIREAQWVARLSAMEHRIRLYSFALEYANMEKVNDLMNEDGLGLVLDSEFYTALTEKFPNEEVFDKDGNELPPASRQLILEGLAEQESKKEMKRQARKIRKGGKP